MTYSEIRELEKVFVEADKNKSSRSAGSISGKEAGEYTLEDYYALPDDQRYELIDGVLYDMAAPAVTHQEIAFEIAVAFAEIYRKIKVENAKVFMSPVDVQLDKDDKTMVQPDVFLVCDPEQEYGQRLPSVH